MAPKIAAISSMVRLIGWIRPVSRGRGGRVGSSRSARQAGVEFGVLQRGAAGLDQAGQRVLQPVQRGAALAALLGRGLAEVAQQRGEAAVAAQRGDADRVPGAQVGGGGERGLGFGLQGGEVVGHGVSVMDLDHAISKRPRSAGAARAQRLPEAKVSGGLRASQPATRSVTSGRAACTFLTISANDGGIVIGDGGQHLAVDLDLGLLQAGDNRL